MARTSRLPADWTSLTDAESATTGPSGEVWVAWEDRRLISRFSPDLSREARVAPKAMRHWSTQFGAESLARMADGRFIVISEDYLPRLYERKHETLLFPADPTLARARHPVEPLHGRLTGLEGYRPTDMALLPDGRALILFRRLLWPLPMRLSCRIALADPAELARTGEWSAREIARLDPPLPTDNYEALAIRPRSDGHVDVWVMSDDNRASTQRTLLLKLELDPTDLPPLPPAGAAGSGTRSN